MASFKVNKTIAEINERIRQGKAVVLNAEEMTEAVRRMGKEKAAREIDVVTTGTFSPMCSSGLLFNIGQQDPPTLKTAKVWMNDVPAYAGLAAVDAYLGATEPTEDDPLNKVYPGRFKYGGGHVIEDLVRGKAVHLRAEAYGTDCYPRKSLDKKITLAELPYAHLLNPRNCYQNYNAAVNLTSRIIYTYMGPLKPNLRNVNFATAGRISPLFNDPLFRTIGLGTRIFLGGGTGYVIGAGTQHVAAPKRNERGLPLSPAGTLMLKGDLKGMNARFLRGLSFLGYGCSLAVGVGIPIPILNEEIAWFTGVDDSDIQMPVKDYGHDYPNCLPRVIQHVTYEDLKSGEVEIMGKKVETVPMTSYPLSLEVANILKSWIEKGEFLLSEPVELLPSA
ncbi:homocysteine biosynthesis protein [Nitratidesulfovibrio sp. D1]|uniref:homocysteine biosynthesis protein n=1 Tax=Nitratidesulfovibrio sp. D1 TaxID=3440151 RepID=UPI003EC153CB